MGSTTLSTSGMKHVATADQAVASESAKSNPIANLWLLFLALVLGGTLLCTAVLMAWPIVAQMAAKMN